MSASFRSEFRSSALTSQKFAAGVRAAAMVTLLTAVAVVVTAMSAAVSKLRFSGDSGGDGYWLRQGTGTGDVSDAGYDGYISSCGRMVESVFVLI